MTPFIERPVTISVALCTWNGGRFLRQQLDSLAAQRLLPVELVICDDGSTDDTREIVAGFAESAPFPVRFFANDVRLGYRANFMKAARRCSASHIAFCDQDDVWDADKLSLCAAALEDPEVTMVVHDAYLCDTQGATLGVRLYGPTHPDLTTKPGPWFHALGFTQVFDRRVLDMQQLDAVLDHYAPDRIAHDQIATFGSLLIGRIAFIARPLALYRQHGNNACGTEPITIRLRLRALLTNPSTTFGALSKAAESRSDYLRNRSTHCRWNAQPVTPALADRYAFLHRLYALRSQLYQAPSIRTRVVLYRSLWTMRAYRRIDDWRLGARHAGRDLALGVLLRSFLLRAA